MQVQEIELEIPMDFYYTLEFYRIEKEKDIVRSSMRRSLMRLEIEYSLSKQNILEWYLDRFFKCDFELNCLEIYDLAKECGITIKS